MLKVFKPLLALSLVSQLFIGCGGGLGGLGSSGTIQGKILIKGHLPGSYVAIKINSRRYYNLVGPLSRVLRSSYQGKKVVLSGKIVAKALGPGMPARFHVDNILKIISR